jgi:hypothetical protein
MTTVEIHTPGQDVLKSSFPLDTHKHGTVSHVRRCPVASVPVSNAPFFSLLSMALVS